MRNTPLAFVEFKENGERREDSRVELQRQVTAVSAWLLEQGIEKGDVVAGFLPNGGDAIVAMLATATLGAIWTSCSPDFGTSGVLDRFGQTQPKVLFCVDQYYYNGKTHDAWSKNSDVFAIKLMDSSTWFVCLLQVNHLRSRTLNCPRLIWAMSFAHQGQCEPVQIGFRDPLFILYSSGTTGAPKCIVHSAGGALVQLTKEHQLHGDIKPGDRVFYYTTLGWMMWNWLATALASGATLMLYDGFPLLS